MLKTSRGGGQTLSYLLAGVVALAIVLATGNALAAVTFLNDSKVMDSDWNVSTDGLNLAYNSSANETIVLDVGAWSLTINGNLVVGHNRLGTLNLGSGNVNVLPKSNNVGTYIGNVSGSVGIVNIDGGVFTAGGVKPFYIGQTGTGTLNLNSGSVVSINEVYVGYEAAGKGTVNIKGGCFEAKSHLYVGNNGTGTLNFDGGTLTVAGDLNIANGTKSAGSFNGTSGTLSLTDSWKVFNVGMGANSTGTVIKEGGDWSCNYLRIGTGSGSTGSFTQNGGTMTVTTELNVGYGDKSTGLFTINGGSVTLTGNNFLTIGRTTGSTATMTVGPGGKYTSTGNNVWGLLVGWDAPGTLNIAGGEVETRILSLCNTVSAANSEVNITDGGVLAIDYVKYTSNTRSTKINIDGGKVKRRTQSGVSNTFLNANANVTVSVGDNGAEFDANGYDIVINEDLENKPEEAGKVRFSGGGTITLGGANSYTGGTTIELGTKVIASSETAKNTVVGKLIVDGTKYLADTSDIVVFEYGEGGLSTENIEFKNCGDGTTAKVSDDCKQIIVDFVARSWATVSGDTKLSALIEAAGGAPASDAIVGIKMIGNYTLTIDTNLTVGQLAFSNGSGSTLVIEEGVTLEVNDVTGINKITNNGALVKTGDGTVAWPFNNASKGVTIVRNGTLKVASNAGGDGTDQTVRVKDGATFDLNGVRDVTVNVILEEGAEFANSGADIADYAKQTVKVTLEGNATATFAGNFGLLAFGYGETKLDLGSKTLTLNGPTKKFWLCNTAITGMGTIRVKHGYLNTTSQASIGEDCTLDVPNGGALILNADLTVKNFVNGTINNIAGNAMLTVKGTLTPGTKAIPKLTLANGATIKATGTAQVVSTTFSASGTIYVDASAITKEALKNAANERIPVLTVPDSFDEKGVNWVPANSTIPNVRVKWEIDEGGKTKTLYLCRSSGTILIVR